MTAPVMESARDVWSQALASPELNAVARALRAAGVTIEECVHESARITEAAPTRHRLEEIRERVVRSTAGVPAGSFERLVLGHTALHYQKDLESARVAPIVKQLACTGLQRFADGRTPVGLTENRFVALCKIA